MNIKIDIVRCKVRNTCRSLESFRIIAKIYIHCLLRTCRNRRNHTSKNLDTVHIDIPLKHIS